MSESCSKCKFWISRFDDIECGKYDLGLEPSEERELREVGKCRRFPPVFCTHDDGCGFSSFDGDATDFFEFVHTKTYEWCGEFKEKK